MNTGCFWNVCDWTNVSFVDLMEKGEVLEISLVALGLGKLLCVLLGGLLSEGLEGWLG